MNPRGDGSVEPVPPAPRASERLADSAADGCDDDQGDEPWQSERNG